MSERGAGNVRSMVLAVLLATALWAFVQTQHTSEVAYFVPLELRGLPSDLVITNEVPATVAIRVAGPRAQQTMLSPRKLTLTLDLTGIQPGTSRFEITGDDLDLPTGLTLTQISPERIQLEVEELVSKEVAVVGVFHGELAAGFRLDREQSRIVPDEVTARVAQSDADAIDSIPTKPVDLQGLKGDLRERVFLDRSDRRIRSVSPETVVMSLEIEEVTIERTFDGLSVEVQDLAPGLVAQVDPQAVRVTVRGPFTRVNGLVGPEVATWVDLAGLTPGTHEVAVQCRPPTAVETVLLDPPRARVLVSAAPTAPEPSAPAEETGSP